MGQRDFEEHYDRLRARVGRFYPRASANDVVQQAYCEALNFLHPDRERDKSFALLWTIAKRVALKQIRDRGRRSRHAEAATDLDEQPSRDRQPWVIAAEREDYCRLLTALSSMRRSNPTDYSLLVGSYLQGHSSTQLAEDFRTTTQAVRARLYRVRKKLRVYLGS